METWSSEHDSRYQEPMSGNLICLSGEIFFIAVKCNDWDSAKDVRTIVPIHTAVNERA